MSSAFCAGRRDSAGCVEGLMLRGGEDFGGGSFCERRGGVLSGGVFGVEPSCVQIAK